MRKRQCRGGVGCVCTVHGGREGLHDDPAAFSCSMAVGGDKKEVSLESHSTSSPHAQNRLLSITRQRQSTLQRKKNCRLQLHTIQIKPSREDERKGHVAKRICVNSLSFEGRGFFSWVSVFFSLLLSKLVTSSRLGLSDMIGVSTKENV